MSGDTKDNRTVLVIILAFGDKKKKKIQSLGKLNSSEVWVLPFLLQLHDAVTKGVIANRKSKMRWPGKYPWREGQ